MEQQQSPVSCSSLVGDLQRPVLLVEMMSEELQTVNSLRCLQLNQKQLRLSLMMKNVQFPFKTFPYRTGSCFNHTLVI